MEWTHTTNKSIGQDWGAEVVVATNARGLVVGKLRLTHGSGSMTRHQLTYTNTFQSKEDGVAFYENLLKSGHITEGLPNREDNGENLHIYLPNEVDRRSG